MRNLLADWFENRTGLPSRLRAMRDEPLPSGPRWGYVCGSALLAILLNRIAVAVSGRDAPRVESQHRHC